LEGLISPETESTRETSNGLQVTEYCQWLEWAWRSNLSQSNLQFRPWLWLDLGLWKTLKQKPFQAVSWILIYRSFETTNMTCFMLLTLCQFIMLMSIFSIF
jgi:hypothetical protein